MTAVLVLLWLLAGFILPSPPETWAGGERESIRKRRAVRPAGKEMAVKEGEIMGNRGYIVYKPNVPKRKKFWRKSRIIGRTYTVRKGDCLATIAKRAYGDSLKWTKIYRANRDKIKKDRGITWKGLLLIACKYF